MSERPKLHEAVEYHVGDVDDREVRIFGTFAQAAEHALSVAITRGRSQVDVVIYSEAGACWYGGDDAVARYREDPDASVFERFEVSVNSVGRVP